MEEDGVKRRLDETSRRNSVKCRAVLILHNRHLLCFGCFSLMCVDLLSQGESSVARRKTFASNDDTALWRHANVCPFKAVTVTERQFGF
jgi:hypothetical protein